MFFNSTIDANTARAYAEVANARLIERTTDEDEN
ncbi:Uncharacterised protein [Actinomyces howellii]|uniref:Uncharacterized protein n=1 Tax=Actinomyces howellii TaxID=52771 RepID=A0A3S4TAR8_9ACTO|nr:Uncharacterised protein [Actinomyces howellii]